MVNRQWHPSLRCQSFGDKQRQVRNNQCHLHSQCSRHYLSVSRYVKRNWLVLLSLRKVVQHLDLVMTQNEENLHVTEK